MRNLQDSLHAGTAGTYSPHCFYIRIDSMADLEPDGDVPTKIAVAIHAHEYVHFLHNVSTSAGAHLFLANLWLLRSLPHCTNANGHVEEEESLKVDVRRNVSLAVRWIRALQGGAEGAIKSFTGTSGTSWTFGDFGSLVETLDFGSHEHRIHGAQVRVEGLDRRRRRASGIVKIGYDLITEGVAYEVDREIRRENGTSPINLDDGIHSYPYLFYGALADHLAGRETTAGERIDLGVCALLTASPGAEFVRLCKLLAASDSRPAAGSRLHHSIRAAATAEFGANAMDFISLTLEPALAELAPGSELHEAAMDILALFRAGFALRTINPVLETYLLGSPLDKESYRERVSKLLDCCVLQEKPEGRVLVQWIGPGMLGLGEEDAAQLARLQSAIHFAQRHFLTSEKFGATARLPPTPCPYSGACLIEATDGNPEVCRTTPWARFMDVRPGELICWYANGVKSLRRSLAATQMK